MFSATRIPNLPFSIGDRNNAISYILYSTFSPVHSTHFSVQRWRWRESVAVERHLSAAFRVAKIKIK